MPNRRQGEPVDHIQIELDAALDPTEIADQLIPERRPLQLSHGRVGLVALLLVVGALFGASIR